MRTYPMVNARALAFLATLLLVGGCSTMQDKADKAFFGGDYKTAFAGYQTLAAKGDYLAELRLSYMYSMGRGVARDDAEAQRWLEKAADDGSDVAAVTLGKAYLWPADGLPDYAQAFRWFQVAADRYDPQSELELSIFYEHGLGVARDHDAALHWLNQFVGHTDVIGAPVRYKFSGGDNIGGFMVAVQQVLYQAAHNSTAAQRIKTGVVVLKFAYQDGKAVDVGIQQSSGVVEADQTAIDILQKALLPPVLSSLSHIQNFQVAFDFGQQGTNHWPPPGTDG